MCFKIDFMSIICGTLCFTYVLYLYYYNDFMYFMYRTSMLYYLRNIFDTKSVMLFCRLVFQLYHSWCRVQKYSIHCYFSFLLLLLFLFFMSNNTIIHFWKAIQHFNFFFPPIYSISKELFFFTYFSLPCLSFSYHKRIIFLCFKLYFSCAIECVGKFAVDIRDNF